MGKSFGAWACALLASSTALAAQAHLPAYEFSRNQTRIFYDLKCYADIVSLVRSAQRSIRLDFYIFGGDTANLITDLLIEKHQQGLDVHVMLDRHMGSVPMNWKQTKPIVARLKKAGVPFQEYTHQAFEAGGHAALDHNKIVVVDDVRASVGSSNFATLFENYHDLCMRVEGPIAGEIGQQFDFDWEVTSGQRPMPTGATLVGSEPFRGTTPTDGSSEVRLLSTGPGRSNILGALIRAIDHAQSKIDVLVHEFDEERLRGALIRAHDRGVKVRVLLDPWAEVSKFTGGIQVPAAIPNLGAVKELKEAGIDVRTYHVSETQVAAHMKSMIVDDEILHAGSANWAFGSWEHIAETNLEIHGGGAVEGARKQFETDWNTRSDSIGMPTPGLLRLYKFYEWTRNFIL